ncbi:MAG TPA: tyrosine-type recombinase/integrase [Bdellovibrionota bacterium]|nr:tyrosine-type recombinase/integrase [Bdellovibrionota bacterium]
MNGPNDLFSHVQTFFQEYLGSERGLSSNTILSYRDTLKLFFHFVATTKGRNPSDLTLNDLTVQNVLRFLQGIESRRKNSVVTRNQRLAALKTFFAYMIPHDLGRSGQYQKITVLSMKRQPHRMMEYLTEAEMDALLQSIDRGKRSGERDYVLVTLLYNTGARVQEICDLTVGDVHWEPPSSVTITGKGRKMRQVPLWPETVKRLKTFLLQRGVAQDPKAKLFVNRTGRDLGRFGVRHMIRTRIQAATDICPSLKNKRVGPHTLRHTTAMHLLHSGVDLTVIKSWLGHVNLSTTHGYIEIDLEMKRKALESCRRPATSNDLTPVLHQNKEIIRWLESL